MHVLCNQVNAVELCGLVLDLQVIRPAPVVEAGTERICTIWGEPLFLMADAARAAVDASIAAGRLVEDAVDDHHVRKHYPSGADLVDDFASKKRRIPEREVPRLLALDAPVTVRECCRLRRLRVIA